MMSNCGDCKWAREGLAPVRKPVRRHGQYGICLRWDFCQGDEPGVIALAEVLLPIRYLLPYRGITCGPSLLQRHYRRVADGSRRFQKRASFARSRSKSKTGIRMCCEQHAGQAAQSLQSYCRASRFGGCAVRRERPSNRDRPDRVTGRRSGVYVRLPTKPAAFLSAIGYRPWALSDG